MEKRRINILCALLILLFSVVVGDVAYHGLAGGFSTFNKHKKGYIASSDLSHIKVTPVPCYTCPDTIRESRTGDALPYRMDQISIVTNPSGEISLFVLLMVLITPVLIFYLVRAVIQFYYFIRDVKRGKIFISENVKRLRIGGWTLFSLGLFTNLFRLIEYWEVRNLQIPGYQIESFDIQYRSFALVILLLLFAEIFALGVKMREEQELTV